MSERAYPEDPAYTNKTKYYDVFLERYNFGKKFTEGKIVLDVPCGSGWGTSFIDNSQETYGIDISHDAIQYAHSHFKGIFFESSMCKMPFENDKFDVALCFEGIEHITKEDGILFINEIKRVVKKDGVIVGSVPILDKNGGNTGNPYHLFEYPEKYLRILLESNFTITEYILKKGGDGPIIFFVLKNQYKNRITTLTSANFFQETVDLFLTESSENELVIINTGSWGEMVAIREKYSKPEIIIVDCEFENEKKHKLGSLQMIKGRVSRYKEAIRGLFR